MDIVFLGSGHFAVPTLQALLDSPHKVSALLTQPDKPAGRGHDLRFPPTKKTAGQSSLPVYQPKKIKSPESIELLKEIAPECIVVVAYGQIIPKAILDIPPRGIINVHASLLPFYRGAAPIQWAIVRGETKTGVTTMKMDEGLDTGPILLQREVTVEPGDTAAVLEDRLAGIGARLLMETLETMATSGIAPRRQDDSLASWAPRIKKEDARIDWNRPARDIECQVRGFIPWPVAFSELRGTTVRVWQGMTSSSSPGKALPGGIITVNNEGIIVGCGGGTSLHLLEVQPQGKKRMSASDFARGQRLAPGDNWNPAPTPQ